MRLMLVCLAAILVTTAPSDARIMQSLTYEKMLDESDLVVIAKPITKTTDTDERQSFPGMMIYFEEADAERDVPAIGFETEFSVLTVLKGENDLKEFMLHHFRDPRDDDPNLVLIDGPSFVFFDPQYPYHSEFLLFLSKETDGRFAPYGGQTDPAGRSIYLLNFPPLQ